MCPALGNLSNMVWNVEPSFYENLILKFRKHAAKLPKLMSVFPTLVEQVDSFAKWPIVEPSFVMDFT